jgi:2-dehydro-3-deoxygluconokinase
MIELSETAGSATPGGSMHRTFGGDTLNTAVYLARSLGEVPAEVHYVTALGDDPFSAEMLAAWQREGVRTDLVFSLPGKLPGLYIIRTDAGGERTFHYWRSAAAARELLRPEQAENLADGLNGFDLVYLSGITLGILDAASRARLFTLLETLPQTTTRRVTCRCRRRASSWPVRRRASRLCCSRRRTSIP